MNAYDLADALRRHKQRTRQAPPSIPRRRNLDANGEAVMGRPRQHSRWTDAELAALHARHANRETIISLAGGDEALRMALCREFKRRSWPIYRWRTR